MTSNQPNIPCLHTFKLWLWCVLVTGTPVQFHFFVSRSLAATLANTAESRLLIGRSSQQRTWTANQSAPFIWLSTFCKMEADQACGKTIFNTYIWWFMVHCTRWENSTFGERGFLEIRHSCLFCLQPRPPQGQGRANQTFLKTKVTGTLKFVQI